MPLTSLNSESFKLKNNEYDVVEIHKLFSDELSHISLEYINDYLPLANKNDLVSCLSLTEDSF